MAFCVMKLRRSLRSLLFGTTRKVKDLSVDQSEKEQLVLWCEGSRVSKTPLALKQPKMINLYHIRLESQQPSTSMHVNAHSLGVLLCIAKKIFKITTRPVTLCFWLGAWQKLDDNLDSMGKRLG